MHAQMTLSSHYKTLVTTAFALLFGLLANYGLANNSLSDNTPQATNVNAESPDDIVSIPPLLDAMQVLSFAQQTCKQPMLIDAAASDLLKRTPDKVASSITFRGTDVGKRVELSLAKAPIIEIQLQTPPARRNQYLLTIFDQPILATDSSVTMEGKKYPALQLALDADCELQRAMRIVYDKNSKQALFIEHLDDALQPTDNRDWLNPELPNPPNTPRTGIRVAMVDSGVNYQLEEIADSLARDKAGEIIGFDFWDMDDKPYDANPARSAYFVQRHGTRTASVLLREAPNVALIPYRYPRPDMTRMTALIEHAASNKVRIVGMPLGGNRYGEWTSFASAATAHPDILFVVSAGNNGRDIDQSPVYPASMEIDNMIVVTSTDDFAQPAEQTNYGRLSVDYLIPAESLPALDYSGEVINVSGSSYAVSRAVALAARLLDDNPTLTTGALKKAIHHHSVRANTSRYVALGYLGDPLADTARVVSSKLSTSNTATSASVTKMQLPLNIVVLDDRWKQSDIDIAIDEMNTIFRDCSIGAFISSWVNVQASDYLKDLSAGHALTLNRKLDSEGTTIYFARDTKMQPAFDAEAFGKGNTRNRPWMTNTLWLSYGIPDSGVALAHELFHIVANSGEHSTLDNNLLRDRSSPDNVLLTPVQCALAIKAGLENGLLRANR